MATNVRRWVAGFPALVAVGALWFAIAPASGATGTKAATYCPALLNDTVPRLQDGAPQDLCQCAGRVVLVVNTASFCGYTPQYEGLEDLHARYAQRGLVILGFTSNDFNQEPKDNRSIADFCSTPTA